MSPPQVRRLSTEVIKAHPAPAQDICIDLSAFDLAMLSAHHIQKGLLFRNPPTPFLHRLKHSLSAALSAFYPLAGRLVSLPVPIHPDNDDTSSTHLHPDNDDTSSTHLRVFVEYNDQTGAEFIHAEADMSIADVTAPVDVPEIVQSFFPYSGAANYDGHSIPLLAVQVTQLKDGVFIGCNFNHALGDGTAFWEFFYAWGEVSRDREISRPPIVNRSFFGLQPPLLLPFSHPDQFVKSFSPPPLRERVFHFDANAMKELKKRTNGAQANTDMTTTISSFQSLSALIWRAITRARGFPPEQKTTCRLAANNRKRLQPPLPQEYFGNCIQVIASTVTVGELMSNDLPWAARQVHKKVASHDDDAVQALVAGWAKKRIVYDLNMFDPHSVMVGSSPWFDMYGCEFGWGKAVAARSGYANKFDGKVSAYPGREGGGSVDMEICLPAHTMGLIEEDEELMEMVSSSA